MSIGAHLLWNRGHGAEQLFRGAVLQSGAASGYEFHLICSAAVLTYWVRFPVSEPEDHAEAFQHLIERVGCDSKSNPAMNAQDDILICLRKLPAKVLYQDTLQAMSKTPRIDQMGFASLHRSFACVQDARNGKNSHGFFHDRPSVALGNGRIAKIPIMIGTRQTCRGLNSRDSVWYHYRCEFG